MAPFPMQPPAPAGHAAAGSASAGAADASRITTPAGSTIEAVEGGGYRVCDARSHCRQAPSLWEAQQLVQWSEVHHLPVDASSL